MDGDDETSVVTHPKQSAELAGGAGFTFADAVVTVFLTALLDEGHAPGVTDAQVTRVALRVPCRDTTASIRSVLRAGPVVCGNRPGHRQYVLGLSVLVVSTMRIKRDRWQSWIL
jgi:hypothetical protein